uniref:Glucuronosyltransferase n=1 Tax=Panagrolaimus sp. PS1159 TaxID=55785 RepID=A0AC35G852_9BILA
MKAILFLLFVFFQCICSYKILLYNPKFGISHVTFTGKIADTLAAAGHDVVVYQPIMDDRITFTGSKNRNIRYFTMPKNPHLKNVFENDTKQDNIWEEESFAKMKKVIFF